MWSALQTPQGNLADEVEFERHGPLLNIYRKSAKVWSKRQCLLCDSVPADFCLMLSACCCQVNLVAVNLRTQKLQQPV